MSELLFDKAEWEKLKKVCEQGYPREVCGLLFGKPGENKVLKIEVLQNVLLEKHAQRLKELLSAGAVALPKERLAGGGAFEFLIDPSEHYGKISEAAKNGLDQIGLFHSHPDHPARPSATDASQPFLSGWANIIVAVHQGKFKEARSWFRKTEGNSFQEQSILLK